jgi:hypothetical protein
VLDAVLPLLRTILPTLFFALKLVHGTGLRLLLMDRGRLARVLGHLVAAADRRSSPVAGDPAAAAAGADDEDESLLVRRAAAAALALDNRGPLELTPTGQLAPHIVRGFEKYGFYVLEGARRLLLGHKLPGTVSAADQHNFSDATP